MKKQPFFTALLLTLLSQNIYCQKDDIIYLNGHNQSQYNKHFDIFHKTNKQQLEGLEHSYFFYIIFLVDSSANVSDLDIIEIPGISMPDIAKSYIKRLFTSANGNWKSNLVWPNKTPSGDLIFSVSLLKINQITTDRLKDFEKIFEFTLTGLRSQKRLKGFNPIDITDITLPF